MEKRRMGLMVQGPLKWPCKRGVHKQSGIMATKTMASLIHTSPIEYGHGIQHVDSTKTMASMIHSIFFFPLSLFFKFSSSGLCYVKCEMSDKVKWIELWRWDFVEWWRWMMKMKRRKVKGWRWVMKMLFRWESDWWILSFWSMISMCNGWEMMERALWWWLGTDGDSFMMMIQLRMEMIQEPMWWMNGELFIGG